MQCTELAPNLQKEVQSYYLPTQTNKKSINWNEYNRRIVEFFFKSLRSQGKPDFIIGVSEDSMVLGNALSRLFGKPIGYIMSTPDGKIAKNVSIVIPSKNNTDFQEKDLKGKGLLVDVSSKVRASKVKDEILKKHPGIENLNTEILFQASSLNDDIVLPDEIFKRLDLSGLQQKHLQDLSDEQLAHMAEKIYDNLSKDQSKTISFKDLDLDPLPIIPQQISNNQNTGPLNVTWDDYGRLIITLALKITRANANINFIVGIGRGGLAIAKAISQILGKPLAATITSSYKGDGECARSELLIAQHISIGDESQLEGVGILIDDLWESGTTVKKTRLYLIKDNISDLVTAVLFLKTPTDEQPNIYIQTVNKKRWIVLPDEIFESLNLTSIEAKDIANISDEKISQLTEDLFDNLPIDPTEKISTEVVRRLILKYA